MWSCIYRHGQQFDVMALHHTLSIARIIRTMVSECTANSLSDLEDNYSRSTTDRP